MKVISALLFIGLAFLSLPIGTEAQGQAKLFLSPSTGGFLVGSTFDISLIVDTDQVSINTVRVELSFPPDRLQIVNPSSGKSFVSLWLQQPSYSNTEGNISFTGGEPGGIKTSSGIVSTITFRAIKAGEAIIKILPSSNVLANDGKGTQILSTVINGIYTLRPKPPEGPKVFSQTHPDETSWYNNNNPIVSWERETGATDFSFILDSYPQTIPDNTSDTQVTTKAYESLTDGLWYFHIKALKENVWGAPTHFLLRIDTTPPAKFNPKVEFLVAAIVGRAFVSFSTTDALSGIDHYGVAAINKAEPPLGSPVFIEAESPYQLPKDLSEDLRVIVRAIDKAGNIRDESADISSSGSMFSKLKNNLILVLLSASVIAFFIFFVTPPSIRQKIIDLSEKLWHKISAKKNRLKRKGQSGKLPQ